MTATATATRAISWFEIPAIDFERAVRFYEAALDQPMHREVFGGVPTAVFARGEGIWFGRNELYFTCTSGGAIRSGQIFP